MNQEQEGKENQEEGKVNQEEGKVNQEQEQWEVKNKEREKMKPYPPPQTTGGPVRCLGLEHLLR